MLALLTQTKTIDYRRLKNQLGKMDEKDFEEIKKAFEKLYSFDFNEKNKPPKKEVVRNPEN